MGDRNHQHCIYVIGCKRQCKYSSNRQHNNVDSDTLYCCMEEKNKNEKKKKKCLTNWNRGDNICKHFGESQGADENTKQNLKRIEKTLDKLKNV